MKWVSDWLHPLLAFAVVFLIRYPIVILGVDVTDEGFNLSNQLLSNAMGIEFIKVAPQWWLSDFIAGSWLKLMDSYGLWGARLGGILCTSLIAMLSTRIIGLVYKSHLGLVLVVLAAALYSQPARILYYDNVPVLLFLIFGFSFVKMILNSSIRPYSILAGCALALLILSKWTMLIAGFIPVLTLVACHYSDKDLMKNLIRPCCVLYITLLLCLTMFCFYLWNHALLGDYFSFSGLAEEHNHLSAQLFRWYWLLRTKVPLVILLFGIPLLFYKFSKKSAPDKAKNSIAIFLGLFLLSILLSFFRSKWFCPFADIQVVYILSYLICIVLGAFGLYSIRNLYRIEEFALFLLGTFLPLAQSLGAAAGISKAYLGMWLLPGILFSLLLRVAKIDSYAHCRNQILSISLIVTAIFGYYGVKQNYFYMGRDSSDLSKLSSPFTNSRLAGVYTTPERKESFDSLIYAMARYTQKRDRILAYFHIPMVYFASGTLPLGDHPWFEAFLSPDRFREKIARYAHLPPPKVIVKSKMNPFNSEWGLKPVKPLESTPETILMAEMMESTVNDLWDLQLVWSNPDFDLYTVSAKNL